ncbi:MAG: glycosyltransferase family 4 protein [Gemmatimonas sp.]|nr:glycosyltransferase family 4 protein [Gemmatimonas sp.]
MKVAVIDVRYPPETFLDRKFTWLAREGVQLTVYSRTVSRTFRRDGVEWRPLLSATLGDVRRRALAYLRALVGGAAVVRADHLSGIPRAIARMLTLRALANVQVIHFEWVLSADSFRALRNGTTAAVTVSLRGSQLKTAPKDPRRQSLAQSIAQTLAAARLVHCVSADICRAAGAFGLDAAKSRIIRPAVAPESYAHARPQRTGTPLRLVSVGSLIWHKGYEFAIVAVAQAVRAGVKVHYRIVGDGDERERLQFAIRELGLEGVVTLEGAIPSRDVAGILVESDAILLASIDEGIANAVLEGMASGLPAIVTDAGGMREAVADGIEGFVVAVRDPAAMANAIVCIARDRSLAGRMGKAARERVEREFSLSQQAKSWKRFYEEAAVAG